MCTPAAQSQFDQIVSRIINEFWTTHQTITQKQRENENKNRQNTMEQTSLVELEEISHESIKGPQQILVETFKDSIEAIVKARFSHPYQNPRTKTMIKLRNDFSPLNDTGNLDQLVPGAYITCQPDSFRFIIGPLYSNRINLIKHRDTQYVELGLDELESLSTFAYLAISQDNLELLYDYITDLIERVLPFNPGPVHLVGYDDVLERCENILSNTNPLTMKRNILLAGPPGCGKSMILKKVALNHPEYIRCALTNTENWLSLIKLFAQITTKSKKKILLVIDEIDELGINRERERGPVYELLRLVDGVEDTGNLVFMAATNRLQDLDPALLRPGRFGPVIPVGMPSPEDQRKVLEYFADRLGAEIDAEAVISQSGAEYSGADLRVAVEDCVIENKPVTVENVLTNLGFYESKL